MTPFLVTFASRLLAALTADGLVEVVPGGENRVVRFVANWLGTRGPGVSLLSSVEAALLACPEVSELFTDLDGLKAVVDDLGEVGVG